MRGAFPDRGMAVKSAAVPVGTGVGTVVGIGVVGTVVGIVVGTGVVGWLVGTVVGSGVGVCVGGMVGAGVGVEVGAGVGPTGVTVMYPGFWTL